MMERRYTDEQRVAFVSNIAERAKLTKDERDRILKHPW